MHFSFLPALLVTCLFSALLPACSVPLANVEKGAQPPAVEQLLEANHFRRARALLAAAPATNAHYYLQLSRVQLGLGEIALATESAEKALSASPGNAAAHVQVAAAAGRAAERASMFRQISLAKRVKKELDEALALDPKNADALYGLVLYSDLAPSFMGGDKERALAYAQELAHITPVRGYLAQAALAHNRKDAAGEEALLRKAVAADPRSYEAHLELAKFGARADALQLEADEQACEALYVDPTRAEAWQILAEQAARAECLPEVDGLLNVYRRFNSDDLSPVFRAAAGMLATGRNLDTAQALFLRYLEVAPDGNAPSWGMARYQLGLISEKQGHIAQALDFLRAAVSDDPTLEEARRDLKRLERAYHPVGQTPSGQPQ